MKARCATKHWTKKEDDFINNSILPFFIQCIYIGRSKNAIINRQIKLNKIKQREIT